MRRVAVGLFHVGLEIWAKKRSGLEKFRTSVMVSGCLDQGFGRPLYTAFPSIFFSSRSVGIG